MTSKERKRTSTTKAFLKKRYFNRFGISSEQNVSQIENSRYFRTDLEALSEVILPHDDDIASFPTDFQMNLGQGFALGQSRDITLNRPSSQVKSFLQEVFDDGNKPNQPHKTPDEADKLVRQKFPPSLWLKSEQIKQCDFCCMTYDIWIINFVHLINALLPILGL